MEEVLLYGWQRISNSKSFNLPRIFVLIYPSKRGNESSNLPYVSIKIPAAFADAKNEMVKRNLIQNANPSHEGYPFIHTPLDHFDLSRSEDTQTCLAYEPMRETLSQYQKRFPRRRIDVPMFKLHIYLILKALDYLHTKCQLIHTDIKNDNILMGIEDDTILEEFANFYKKHDQRKHVRDDGRIVYLSDSGFGKLRDSVLIPKLSDFNTCFPQPLEDNINIQPIQSHSYRVP
ncbi:hypothetical protein NW759_007855 [Fusarium solani]|nr:hypothetical protein NW759_007855 [Fusarium solani]